MTRHTEPEPWDVEADEADASYPSAHVSAGVDESERDDRCEAGPTGNLADDALERSLRRTRRHLEERHRRTFARDLERVRAALGFDDTPADPSRDDSASGAGGGGDGDGDEDDEPRHVRNLERELHLFETKKKMGIDAPPVCVGDYALERRLGGGGMGVVWKASDPRIEQTVALKILRRTPERGQTVGLLALAGNEGTAMAKVQHVNVAIVHTVGDADGQPFIVMEYVSGLTLSDWVAENEPSEAALLDIYAQIARGLQAVHDAGFVHADFKPDNVLVNDDGVPKVVDFGLAVKAGPGVLGGTPEYMALEQLHREAPKTTFKSDQYAFCVALFEDLVGSHPYVGQSYDQFARTIRDSQPNISPAEIRKAFVTRISSNLRERHLHRPERLRRLPRWLQRALKCGLDPDPERRFHSMEELATTLERPKRRARFRRTVKILGGAALLGAVAVVSVAYSMLDDPCAVPSAASTKIWNDDVVASLPKSVQGPAREILDPYMGRWAQARTEVCETRGEISAEAHDARKTCLNQRLDAAAVALGWLKNGEMSSGRASEYLKEEDPWSCLLIDEAITKPPPDKVEDVRQAYSDLETEVFAAELAENYESAQASADRLVDEAIELGYSPLIAKSLYYRGRVLLALSVNRVLDVQEANAFRARGEQDLVESIRFAAGSDEVLLFDASVFHMRYYGVAGHVFSDEDKRLFDARFATGRLDVVAQATVKDARAIHYFRQGFVLKNKEKRKAALDKAILLLEEALVAYRGGGDRFAEAKALENLGNALYHAGKPAAALEILGDAELKWYDIDGPESTYLGPIYAIKIQALSDTDPEKSVRWCRGKSSWIRAQSRSLARAKIDLACAQALWGDDASLALELALRAADILRGPEKLQALLIAAGLRLRVDGHTTASLAEADDLLKQADSLYSDLYGSYAPRSFALHTFCGRLHLRRGEFSKAADRLGAAREQLDPEDQSTLHEGAELLLDLAEADRGMNHPQDPELLEDAASYIEKIAEGEPEDPDLPALRRRLAALQRPAPEPHHETPETNHGR